MYRPASLLLIWLGVLSALAFVLFGWDKLMARLGRRRVPEAALLGCAALGGALGALIAMPLFHHKTRKSYFWWTVILSLAAHLALLAYAALRG